MCGYYCPLCLKFVQKPTLPMVGRLHRGDLRRYLGYGVHKQMDWLCNNNWIESNWIENGWFKNDNDNWQFTDDDWNVRLVTELRVVYASRTSNCTPNRLVLGAIRACPRIRRWCHAVLAKHVNSEVVLCAALVFVLVTCFVWLTDRCWCVLFYLWWECTVSLSLSLQSLSSAAAAAAAANLFHECHCTSTGNTTSPELSLWTLHGCYYCYCMLLQLQSAKVETEWAQSRLGLWRKQHRYALYCTLGGKRL